MTIGSLFSGVGGLEHGLEAAGFGPVVFQVEIDAFCRKVLAKHWPEADRSVSDVCLAGAATLPKVDLICGGFPCVDVSSAGKRVGLEGARSGLWYEYRRVLDELRPHIAVVENVASGAKKWLPTVRRQLCELGYDTTALAISAADVGAPHRRARIFVVGVADAYRQRESQSAEGVGEGRGRTIHGCPDVREGGGSVGRVDGSPYGLSGRIHGGGLDGIEQVCFKEAGATGCGSAGIMPQMWPERSEVGAASPRLPDGDRCDGRMLSVSRRDRESNGPEAIAPCQGLRGVRNHIHQVYIREGEDMRRDLPLCHRQGQCEQKMASAGGDISRHQWPAGRGSFQHEWEPPRTVAPKTVKDRVARVKALGNAVVPQNALIVGRWIRGRLEGKW